MFENLNKLSKSSYDTMKDLYALQSKFSGQMIEQQLVVLSLGVEFFSRQMKLASEAKGYKEILNGQTEITSDISNKVQGIARNTLDILTESKDEMNAWFDNCVKEAEKGFKEAAKIIPINKVAA
jgi:Phasin protein.